MSAALQRTPLHALHLELGARMVPFAGYELPLQYGAGLRAEHLWTREHAGLFDVSHMGQLRVRGPSLHAALERALPVDFDRWPQGLQKYSLLLNDAGGIDDDLMVTRLADAVAIVVNAACKESDLARLRALCPELRFELLDHALIALQGPAAESVLPEATGLKFMQAGPVRIARTDCFVSRSGYTGEDGFEISVPSDAAVALARHFLENRAAKPVGLGARDTLRLEAGLPLYGQDLDAATTPQEAGLAWAIAAARRPGGAKAGGFPGFPKVFASRKKFMGMIGETPVPVRHGAQIVDASGTRVGTVTSGTVSPTLGRPVLMAYLAPEAATPLFALVRNQYQPVTIARLPFVPKRYRRG